MLTPQSTPQSTPKAELSSAHKASPRRTWSNGAARLLAHRASSNVTANAALRRRITELEHLVCELSKPANLCVPQPVSPTKPASPVTALTESTGGTPNTEVSNAATAATATAAAAREPPVSETRHADASTQTDDLFLGQHMHVSDWFVPQRVTCVDESPKQPFTLPDVEAMVVCSDTATTAASDHAAPAEMWNVVSAPAAQ